MRRVVLIFSGLLLGNVVASEAISLTAASRVLSTFYLQLRPDGVAACGKDSQGGDVGCGMQVCCSSWGQCGTTDEYCDVSSCQEGFGSCGQVPSLPQCDDTSAIKKRTIGYWQGSNLRTRQCQTVSPEQIRTDNLTHLIWAFASVNPKSFKIAPGNDKDVDLYRNFTDLKRQGELETWISVGGHDFSNSDAATHTTWSDLCSTEDTRSTFISSVIKFMDSWGFQGVDLNWEYPGQAARGGKAEDIANFVSLVKEMRAAFNDSGNAYGISVPLPPGYNDLRWYDAKAMEPYVDWFNFMAYDLHGMPDTDDDSETAVVQAQADIREIVNDTLPLWFAGLDSKKINFGMALYGRGYTLSNSSCADLGCKVAGPSQRAECTNATGVMSLAEIHEKIEKDNLQPVMVDDAMIKYIHWGDQWIGFDDEETISLKSSKAAGMCFGGTAFWSLDFLGPDAAIYS